MRKIFVLAVMAVFISLASCGDDGDLNPTSIFGDTTGTVQNDFDRWLLANYTYPYNIEFKYRYDDKEAHQEYNVVPAEYRNSIAAAKLVKHLWVDAYNELMGRDFLRQYSPRMIQLIGSSEYEEDLSEVLGTAEGGMKIFLTKINSIDPDGVDVEFLKFYTIKTMYHEFGHIMHQTKNYSTDFNLVSNNYQGPSWVNVGDYYQTGDAECLKMGFVSAYATSATQEDFVEILSFYVVYGKSYWEEMVSKAGVDGAKTLGIKLTFVKDYLIESWGIDIDKLQEIVQRRLSEINELDLNTLN